MRDKKEGRDGFFEGMWGVRTRGGTVMRRLERVGGWINFWGDMVKWVGGMGMMVLGVAIVGMLGVGGRQVFKGE
ncbi:potassium transporter TrkG, partial [Neisseria sicca]|uniref:potassium transporter TrkG n=1 Tax=Neisseria sicca TaxID=490 RepID=UPI0034D95890